MKINDIKNLIPHKEYSVRSMNKGQINVYRDWNIILILTFVAIVSFIIWSLFILKQIKNDEFAKVNPDNVTTRSAVNQKNLDTVTNIFIEKNKVHESLKNTPLPISDPSR